MHLIVTQASPQSASAEKEAMFRFAFSDPVAAPVALHGLQQYRPFESASAPVILLPNRWQREETPLHCQAVYHNGYHQCSDTPRQGRSDEWNLISNGRFIASFDARTVRGLLANIDEDAAALTVEPSLASNYEKIVFTSTGAVAGFCRLYSDSILPARLPATWPHHLFIRQAGLERIFTDGKLPLEYDQFCGRLNAGSLKIRCFCIGGTVLDLHRPDQLFHFLVSSFGGMYPGRGVFSKNRSNISFKSSSPRVYGKVLLGDNVDIGENVTLVGPVIVSDHVSLAKDSIVKGSIIGAHCSIPKGRVIQDTIVPDQKFRQKPALQSGHFNSASAQSRSMSSWRHSGGSYRTWPVLSYPGFIKRAADIGISLCALILLAPIFPVIAAAIKLSSAGPVFFKHKRQGLHATEFHCLKFRTMITGADGIQDKLRVKNQVDGPQFKIEDDPRVTAVGRFLRDTYIDELPQLMNVLMGHMSLIGPRPSPQKENSLCPVWHDARLSVRPGISGLWQIKRTRQPGRDFQEWIYYDVEYIRHLSLKLDMYICWQTIRKIASNFFNHF